MSSVAIDLKQLSARLGLSPTTVSRALNGYTDVSEVTRRRVAQAAVELGYRPNLAARRLALGRADAVGIVYAFGVDYLGNPAFQEALSGLVQCLEASNVDLLLAAAAEKNELLTYERMVQGRRVDGLIVAHTRVKDPRIEYLRSTSMPFLAYGRTSTPEDFPWFDFDNDAGSRLAVRELAALGHRHIGYVHAPLTYNFAFQRHAGFVAAMREAGLEPDPGAMAVGSMERRAGYAAGQQLLGLRKRPTAILVDNNVGGVGVVRACLDAGVEIGKAVSVVVFDGVPSDTLLQGLSIAAVDQPTPFQSGQTMGQMILSLIEAKPLSERQVLRVPRYVPGNSVGPAP